MTTCQTTSPTDRTCPPLAPPPAVFPWRPLALLSAAAFGSVTLEMLPAGLLPDMTADLGVGAPRIGLLVTVWALTVAVATLPLSRATRRLRRPRALGLALAVLGGASLLSALAPTYAGVAALRLLAATGHGLFWSVLLVYAVSLAPEGSRGRAVAVVQVGPVLATVGGLPVGTWLAGEVGWRWVVAAVGAAIVAGAALLARVLPDADAGDEGPTRADGRDPTVVPVVAGAVLGALALVAHFAVFTFVAPLTTGPWGLERADVGSVLLVFGVAGAAGLLAVGLVPDRAAQPALVGVVAALAATFGMLAVAEGAAPVHALAAVWGLGLGMLPSLFQARVIGVASPAFRNAAGAVLVVTFNLGIAAGAVVGGGVIDRAGLDRLLPLAAGVAAAAALGLLVLGTTLARRVERVERQRVVPTADPMP